MPDLDNTYKHHEPKNDQVARYQNIRDYGKVLSGLVMAEVPESRERSLALTKIDEAVMWANAGIARNE